MRQAKLFYDVYDTLYGEKDYSHEVAVLLRASEKYSHLKLKQILEIGCGTGNHTGALAKTGKRIVAIDVDAEMVKRAKVKTKKLPNVEVKLSRVESLAGSRQFELILAAFNVVTYIPDFEELVTFFAGVSKQLKKNGVLVFDCWNGIAAMKDPPQDKKFAVKFAGKKLKVSVKSKTDFFAQKTELTFRFNGKDAFSFQQTLWTPEQIRYAVEKNGLEILECSKNFQLGRPARAKDWKIMFVCKKR